MFINGNSLEVLRHFPDNFVDLIVTDPPYALVSDEYKEGKKYSGGFMGKKWDNVLVSVDLWKECYRVLKQGKLAFVMSSPRQDVLSRMIINLQDAGFRTNYLSIYHTFASGFPKAKNNKDGSYVGVQMKPAVEVILVVSKGKTLTWLDSCRIPYSSGDEPENVFASLIQICDSVLNSDDTKIWYNKNRKDHDHHASGNDDILGKELHQFLVYAQNHLHLSNASQHENSLYATQDSQFCCPFCRHFYDALTHWVQVYDQDESPLLSGVLSHIRQFALEHKHIPPSQCNVHLSNVHDLLRILGLLVSGDSLAYCNNPRYSNINQKGRFPANLLVSDNILNDYSKYFSLDSWADTFPFIITPKASKSERNEGCEDLPLLNAGSTQFSAKGFGELDGHKHLPTKGNNNHPTVKPIKLMSYLITLGSREGDTVLDPFVGSGTTYKACLQTHRRCIGIEINKEYIEIAKARIAPLLKQTKLV